MKRERIRDGDYVYGPNLKGVYYVTTENKVIEPRSDNRDR